VNASDTRQPVARRVWSGRLRWQGGFCCLESIGGKFMRLPDCAGKNSFAQFVAAREDARRSLRLGLQRAFRGKEWKRGRQPRLAAMPKPFSASLWGIGATTGVSGTSKPACYTGDTFCDSRTM